MIRINIPPLRERKEDIPVLASSILKRFDINMGKKISGFTADAMNKLKNYNFYGNVRELENIIERAVIFTDGELINSSDLELTTASDSQEFDTLLSSGNVESMSLRELEKKAIINSLKRNSGNRTKTAKELGISRRTLISKIHEFDLDF